MEDWTPEAVRKNVAIFLFVIRGITAWYFLARGGSITLEVTGRRRHCKQLCGGMENSMLCKVLLFKKSDHKPFKRPVNEEGLTARNVSLK